MKRLLLIALLVAGCGGPSIDHNSIPWQSGLPPEGVVIYTVDEGYGVCDNFRGCPTRIVQAHGLCITETYRTDHWELRETKSCPDGVTP